MRSQPLKRTPMKRTSKIRKQYPEKPTRRHPRPKGPDGATVAQVMRRALRGDEVCCEVCGEVVWGHRAGHWSIHHRRGRDGRADSHSVQNLLLVCGVDNMTGCHGRIHQRRSESRPAGWWLSRAANENPLSVPVLIDRGSRYVYLTESGQYSEHPPVTPAGVL